VPLVAKRVEVEVLQDLSGVAAPNEGFLQRRRWVAKTVLPDGTRTAPYIVDFVERDPHRADAVALCIYAPSEDPEDPIVLLRRQVRVALHRVLGHPMCLEVVAGLIENGDDVDVAASKEAYEEAGIRIPLHAIRPLGQPIFPTPASFTERIHLRAAQVDPEALQADQLEVPPTDGSPMEAGADLWSLPLSTALGLAHVEPGQGPHGLFLVDAKTEIALHRLREELRG
jgi:8-oxo-dGTP pyrophosphatase MutT (NUDIX family)